MKKYEPAITFADIVSEKDSLKREILIETLVSLMTLDEKMRFMGGTSTLQTLIFYGSATFTAGGCERLGVPEIHFTDGPRGVMLNKSTCFPVSMARGATWDPELEEKVGSAIGVEAREQGANLAGSVCVNLLRHPAWGRAQETYGEDPVHLGAMGAALTKGIQKHIMACVKHYAVNSIENARFWVDVEIDDRTLFEVYLPHFKKCIDAGAASVMGAYNKMNGSHCCHNKRLLTEILKEEWAFDGFAISDWTFALRGSDAAEAGLDIEMPTAFFMGLPLKLKVKNGTVSEDLIDAAVIRIVHQLARFHNKGNAEDYSGKVACPEHAALALEAARKSVVLLKNNGDILPLDKKTIRNITVVGELADAKNIGDKGSSNLHPPYVVSILEGIKNKSGSGVNIEYIKANDLDKLKTAARNADAVIIVAGLTSKEEGEFVPLVTPGGDRDTLALPKRHEKMINTAAAENPNCIVVLQGGSAITMDNWIDNTPAVLMAWYPGMEGGNAIAEILFGDVSPSGKLPITFPRSEDQLPPFSKWARNIKYDYFHGYRLFDKENHSPLFQFGFGLSYTTYEYSNLRLNKKTFSPDDPITVKVDIANTGKFVGEEIAQLYIAYPNSKVERPVRELKTFRRVPLNPGETKTVTFKIQPKDLAYYDTNSKSWIIESAEYEIYAGGSSAAEDLTLKTKFKIS